MKYAEICSGINAPTVAWKPLGWEPVFFSEIDPFPIAVSKHHYPHVPNAGDFTQIQAGDYDRADVVIGGTPCVDGDTLITTSKGYIPISEISKGDMVLTHKGRWRRVTHTGRKYSTDRHIITGYGCNDGITITSNHRIYTHGGEWIPAGKMQGKKWAFQHLTPLSAFPSPRKRTDRRENEPRIVGDFKTGEFIGRWIGDGCVYMSGQGCRVCLSDSADKAEEIEKIFRSLDITFRKRIRPNNQVELCANNKILFEWLTCHFGDSSHTKKIPVWVLGQSVEFREGMVKGLRESDGCEVRSGFRYTTVSKQLALSTTMLFNSVGYVTTKRLARRTGQSEIRGAVIKRNDYYELTSTPTGQGINEHGKVFGTVRGFSKTGDGYVYNLTVDDDNSYVANGIIVHNCQSFSLAGDRYGLDDSRGNLTLEYSRLVDRLRPTWFIWENVAGVFSIDDRWTFGRILAEFAGYPDRHVFEPPDDGWRNFGIVEPATPESYGLAWRVFDTQFTRVSGFPRAIPQRRRRVFVVGYLGDWRYPAKVLFEPQGVYRHSEPRREAGKGTAATIEKGAGVCGAKVANPLTHRMHKGINTTVDEGQTPIICFDTKATEVSPMGVAFAENSRAELRLCGGDGHVSSQLSTTEAGKPGQGTPAIIEPDYRVRRLTPEECETLQGFPRGYTRIAWNRKKSEQCPDGPRYKALGNSMSTNVIRHIGERIESVNNFIQGLYNTK